MSIISPTNKSSKNGTAKKRWLVILALFIIFLNLIFFIWLFTGEKNSYYYDQDKDGFGNLAEIKKSKIKPWGYVSNHDDTDDNDPCIPDSTSAACLGQNAQKEVAPSSEGATSGTSSSSAENGTALTITETSTPTTEIKPITKNLIFFYKDTDGDGFGDPKERKEFAVDEKPSDYVSNGKDACPTRKGPASNNGCPEYKISLPSEAFVGENLDVKIVGETLEPGDKVNWITASNINKITSARELEAMGQIVGMYKISAEISNSDGFAMSVPSATISFKIKPNVLADMFKPFFTYGSALGSNASNLAVLKNKSDDAKKLLKQNIKDGILSGATVFDRTGGIVNDLETFINADIIGGTLVGGVKVNKVKYSTQTGKITEIHLQ